jgi:hypothetical protein
LLRPHLQWRFLYSELLSCAPGSLIMASVRRTLGDKAAYLPPISRYCSSSSLLSSGAQDQGTRKRGRTTEQRAVSAVANVSSLRSAGAPPKVAKKNLGFRQGSSNPRGSFAVDSRWRKIEIPEMQAARGGEGSGAWGILFGKHSKSESDGKEIVGPLQRR